MKKLDVNIGASGIYLVGQYCIVEGSKWTIPYCLPIARKHSIEKSSIAVPKEFL